MRKLFKKKKYSGKKNVKATQKLKTTTARSSTLSFSLARSPLEEHTYAQEVCVYACVRMYVMCAHKHQSSDNDEFTTFYMRVWVRVFFFYFISFFVTSHIHKQIRIYFSFFMY